MARLCFGGARALLLLGLATICCSSVVPNVPYRRQVMRTSCGSACLQMVLGHRGYSLDQMAIIDVLRTSPDVGTTTFDVARGACFSVLSSAMCELYPDHVPKHGWKGYPLGSAWFSHRAALGSTSASDCWLDQLRLTVDAGFPVEVLMGGESPTDGGHFRVIIGYEGDTWKLHDPWTRGIPHVVEYSSEQLCWLWNYTEHVGDIASYGPYPGVAVSPWTVQVSCYEHANYTTINSTITYATPPGSWDSLVASDAKATLVLPSNGITLMSGQKQTLSVPISNPGDSTSVEWRVLIDQLDRQNTGELPMKIEVVATGIVSGSVPASVLYDGYSYKDTIGGKGFITYS